MKWVYSIGQKQTAALLLAIVFVVVGVVNIIDRNTINSLETSFESVYKDRLLAESYIYRLSEHLYKKKLLMQTREPVQDVMNEIGRHNLSIHAIIIDYEQTQLTASEAIYFRDLKKYLSRLEETENQLFSSQPDSDIAEENHKHFDAAVSNLQYLSDIQISEGRWLNEHSKRVMASADTLTELELAVLICLGLIIQVLIFSSRSVVSRVPRHHSLN